MELPRIAKLQLQPLKVPCGWNVQYNSFYQLDPDEDLAGREILHFDGGESTDPWEDVLFDYFDRSFLWYGMRSDKRYRIELSWTPMGERDGQFFLEQYNATPICFSETPPKTLEQRYEDVQIAYELDEPVEFPAEPERAFESRDREKIAVTLNQCLRNAPVYGSERSEI